MPAGVPFPQVAARGTRAWAGLAVGGFRAEAALVAGSSAGEAGGNCGGADGPGAARTGGGGGPSLRSPGAPRPLPAWEFWELQSKRPRCYVGPLASLLLRTFHLVPFPSLLFPGRKKEKRPRDCAPPPPAVGPEGGPSRKEPVSFQLGRTEADIDWALLLWIGSPLFPSGKAGGAAALGLVVGVPVGGCESRVGVLGAR